MLHRPPYCTCRSCARRRVCHVNFKNKAIWLVIPDFWEWNVTKTEKSQASCQTLSRSWHRGCGLGTRLSLCTLCLTMHKWHTNLVPKNSYLPFMWLQRPSNNCCLLGTFMQMTMTGYQICLKLGSQYAAQLRDAAKRVGFAVSLDFKSILATWQCAHSTRCRVSRIDSKSKLAASPTRQDAFCRVA